ncbi:matrixin family metalloprotease [Blastococcus sp. SYSU DS0539]
MILFAMGLDPRGLVSGVPGSVPHASWPTPGFEAADHPLGSPVPAPASGGTHLFVAMQEDDVRPVAYDPCRPIHYVIRPDNAPAGGEALIHEAFVRISGVTGLQFVYDGATAESASDARESFQPDRYGDRWAPVLVSWQTEVETPEFATGTAGLAGSASVEPPGGPRVFVTGTVQLDAAAFADMLADPVRLAGARAVVLHELGHLVGLAHVADAGQLMYPSTSAVLDFAPGDLSGLVELGRGECVPSV